jgi:hypothetical protein
VRENFTQGSVRGEPGDRLSYRVAAMIRIHIRIHENYREFCIRYELVESLFLSMRPD